MYSMSKKSGIAIEAKKKSYQKLGINNNGKNDGKQSVITNSMGHWHLH